MFIWWKDLFWNIRIGRVSFVKELERWEDSLENRRRGRGLWAKLPFLLPLSSRRTGEEASTPATVLGRQPGSSSALVEWGKRERAARGVNSRQQLERRWPVGAWPRRRAASTAVALLWCLAAVRSWGKSTREPWGLDSPAHLGRWRPVDGSPRRRAELGGYGRGGGAGELEEGCAAAVRVVVVVCGVGALL